MLQGATHCLEKSSDRLQLSKCQYWKVFSIIAVRLLNDYNVTVLLYERPRWLQLLLLLHQAYEVDPCAVRLGPVLLVVLRIRLPAMLEIRRRPKETNRLLGYIPLPGQHEGLDLPPSDFYGPWICSTWSKPVSGRLHLSASSGDSLGWAKVKWTCWCTPTPSRWSRRSFKISPNTSRWPLPALTVL